MQRLLVIRCVYVVLVCHSAEEHDEFNVLHLLGPGLISDGVSNGHHRLRIDGSDHEFRHFWTSQVNFAEVFLAFFISNVTLLRMSEGLVHSQDLTLVFLKNVVDLDSVALTESEIVSIHVLGIGIDQLLEHSDNTFTGSLAQILLFVTEICQSNDHFKELVTVEILFSGVCVLVMTDTDGHNEQIEVCETQVVGVEDLALVSE